MVLLTAEVHALRDQVAGDPTRPLTAEQLCERWGIKGEGVNQLRNLRKRCDRLSLRAMPGSRGSAATYRLADVLRAEKLAND